MMGTSNFVLGGLVLVVAFVGTFESSLSILWVHKSPLIIFHVSLTACLAFSCLPLCFKASILLFFSLSFF